MQVFIDTNILLNFYHFTSDDLETLRSVFVSFEKGDIRLYLTDQVRDEFNRNREAKLRDALRQFRDFRLADNLPYFMKAYPEYESLLKLSKDFKLQSKSIQEKVDSDIRDRNLQADRLIDGIFAKSQLFETSDSIYSDAVRRVETGNPPGKKGSIGDAINWLLLLECVPDGETLHLVSDDADFRSVLRDSEPSPFLDGEWRERKNADLRIYKSLRDFFKANYSDIEVEFDPERHDRIRALEESWSFRDTHAAVAKLIEDAPFSYHEAKAILDAMIGNNQVSGIRGDSDVANLLRIAILPHKDRLLRPPYERYVQELLEEDESDSE